MLESVLQCPLLQEASPVGSNTAHCMLYLDPVLDIGNNVSVLTVTLGIAENLLC
jgi:hypothetical protein